MVNFGVNGVSQRDEARRGHSLGRIVSNIGCFGWLLLLSAEPFERVRTLLLVGLQQSNMVVRYLNTEAGYLSI